MLLKWSSPNLIQDAEYSRVESRQFQANLLQRIRTKHEVLRFDKAMHAKSSLKHLQIRTFGSLEVAEKSQSAHRVLCAISCEPTQLCPIVLEQLPVHLFSHLQQWTTIRKRHSNTSQARLDGLFEKLLQRLRFTCHFHDMYTVHPCSLSPFSLSKAQDHKQQFRALVCHVHLQCTNSLKALPSAVSAKKVPN